VCLPGGFLSGINGKYTRLAQDSYIKEYKSILKIITADFEGG